MSVAVVVVVSITHDKTHRKRKQHTTNDTHHQKLQEMPKTRRSNQKTELDERTTETCGEWTGCGVERGGRHPPKNFKIWAALTPQISTGGGGLPDQKLQENTPSCGDLGGQGDPNILFSGALGAK